MTERVAVPPNPPTPVVHFETRLDPQRGRRIFYATLVFSVPIALAALAVAADAAFRTPFEWVRLGAAALLGVFAYLSVSASLAAWRVIGSRLWLIDDGVLLERPEKLFPLSADKPERGWKKGAGPILKIRIPNGQPTLSFVPGVLLMVGGRLTIQSLVLGTELERLETALNRRAIAHAASSEPA